LNSSWVRIGASRAAQTGNPGRNASGKAINLAPPAAASSMTEQALWTLRSMSRNTGATWAAATLKAGYWIMILMSRCALRAAGRLQVHDCWNVVAADFGGVGAQLLGRGGDQGLVAAAKARDHGSDRGAQGAGVPEQLVIEAGREDTALRRLEFAHVLL